MAISTQNTQSMSSERSVTTASTTAVVYPPTGRTMDEKRTLSNHIGAAGSLLEGVYTGKSLIDPIFDHDSCGVGFVASVDAVPTHEILQQALTALGRLAHRGAVASDGKSSDGVGVTAAVPRALLLRVTGVELAEDAALGVG